MEYFRLGNQKTSTPSFCEELAFKTLESYTQGEKQSVRNFYNEILKLCKQADTSMSESTKLKNLLNKVKPTIQLEVRKKKPKTTTEFLAYAVEVEELLQLSNVSIDTDINYPSRPKNFFRTINTPSNFFSNSSNDFNSNYASVPQTYSNNNPVSSSFASYRSYPYTSDRARTFKPNYYSQSNQYSSTNNRYTDNTNLRKQKPTPQYKKAFKQSPKANSNSVNTVFSSTFPSKSDTSNSSISPIICQICNQLGHDASSCSSFQ